MSAVLKLDTLYTHCATDVCLCSVLQMGPYPSYPPTQTQYPNQSHPYPVPPAQPSYAPAQPKQPPVYPAQQPPYYPAEPTSMPPPGLPHPPISHEMGDVTARMGAATVQDSMPTYQVSDDCVCSWETEGKSCFGSAKELVFVELMMLLDYDFSHPGQRELSKTTSLLMLKQMRKLSEQQWKDGVSWVHFVGAVLS